LARLDAERAAGPSRRRQSCLECERPICTDCARTAAVGLKCPECAKLPRTALARIPHGKLALAIAVGLVASLVAGIANSVLGGHISFFGFIIAWFLGMGVGELMRRAARRLPRSAAGPLGGWLHRRRIPASRRA